MSPPPEDTSSWQRHFVRPISKQLQQGITPEKISLTIALGVSLSLFPILGATTILCALAGALWQLNQPVIHLVSWACYPLQLILVIPFYRAGESLFHQPHVPLSVPLLFERFHAGVGQFLRDFSLIALQGIVVWCLVAPLLVALCYFALRLPLRALARRVAA